MKKWMKRIMVFALAALTLFGTVACGKVEMPQGIKEYLCVEHTYGAGEVERWATCIREGRVKHTCTECGHEKYETLTRVSHTPYTVPAREATCAQTGYTEHTACAVCGAVMNNSKTTIAKIPCTHENDFYAGMGVYTCGLCGDEHKFYKEIDASNLFYMGMWYRCYFPTYENASAIMTFTILDQDGEDPFGYIEDPIDGSLPIYSFSLDFSKMSAPEVDVTVFIEDYEYSLRMEIGAEVLMSGSHDYSEVFLDADFSLSSVRGSDFQADIAFSSRSSYDVTTKLENGARLVMLDGIGKEYPKGSM